MAAGTAGQGPGRRGGGIADGGAGAALRELEAMLRETERTGRADPGLPGRIAGLRRMADEARARWEASRSGDWFLVCQVAFSMGLVLGKMENGIRAGRGGRHGIVPDSLSVLPAVSRAMGIVQSGAAYPGLADDAAEALMAMMDRAEDAGLDTPIEELDKTIDWGKWGRIMPAVVRNLES